MKISYYILISFGIILILFSLVTFHNIQLSKAVNENSTYLSRSTDIIRYTGRFQRNLLLMVNGLRGYLLTGERSFIISYDSANAENDVILGQLSTVITDSSQLRLLAEIRELNNEWTEGYTDPIKQAKMLAEVNPENLASYNKFYKERFASGRENQIQKALQAKFRAFSVSEYEIRENNKIRLAVKVQFTTRLSIIFIIAAVLIAIAIIGFILYKISTRIRQMSAMANTIAAGNYDIRIDDTMRDELNPLGQSLNRMAGELSKNISLLQRSNQELEEFAHIVSHDMKGPLRGIGNVITWIEEDHKNELTPTVSEYLELMKERVVKAEALIEGLLSYARIGREEDVKELVSVDLLVNEVLDNLPAHPNVRIEKAGLPDIFGEKILLFQVFSNLIGNAIKYTDRENGLVKIYYKEHADHFEFFIEDNGIGIAPQHHKRIFLIFQTLDNKDEMATGTGVGLAIVKKIISTKNQHIKLTSQPGKGSIFSFTWPKK